MNNYYRRLNVIGRELMQCSGKPMAEIEYIYNNLVRLYEEINQDTTFSELKLAQENLKSCSVLLIENSNAKAEQKNYKKALKVELQKEKEVNELYRILSYIDLKMTQLEKLMEEKKKSGEDVANNSPEELEREM